MSLPVEPRSDLETAGYVGGIAAVTAWGANAVILKFLTGAMPIAILNASRLVMASALFLVIVGVLRRNRGVPKLPPRVWLGVAIAGFVGTSLYQFLFANGIKLSSASLTAMVSSTNPVWIGVIGTFLGQQLSRWQFIGIPVTILGVALLSWQSIATANVAPLGVGLLILSNIAWAVYTVASRGLFKYLPPLEFTAFSFALGALPYVLFTVGEWFKPEVAHISSLAWGWVVLSAIVAQVIGFIGWFVGTERLGAARVSVLLNITPVVGLLLAALVLGETLTPLKLGAIAVIFVGVYLANRRDAQ
jgi:drug/metabolite transporter, DME family